jgi:hypothetical protein
MPLSLEMFIFAVGLFIEILSFSGIHNHHHPRNVDTSVAEPHHFFPGENFDAALASAAPAPAPTLQYSKANFLKRTKV